VAGKPFGLRVVAAFEAFKGLLVLVASGMLYRLLRSDVQDAAETLVRHFHLNPARHTPRVFAETLVNLGNAHLIALSFGAIAYASVRFAEAYGLWHGKSWAWGFGIISAGLYIPFELAELTRHVSWTSMLVTIANVAVVVILWRARAVAR
jgi:uncharacterized membrane protein (DUF2068 family)